MSKIIETIITGNLAASQALRRLVRSAAGSHGKSTHVITQKQLRHALAGKRGFGLNELIGIAAGIIIAAVVVIPGLRIFAKTVMDGLTGWWDSISAGIFTTVTSASSGT